MKRISFHLLRFPLTLLVSSLVSSTFAQANEESHETFYKQSPPAAELAQRPAIPKLLSPQPLAEISSTASTIELKWASVEHATAYALQVSADPIFFNLLVNEPLYKQTTYTLKDMKLQPNKNYYWRVAALKEDNQPGTMKSLFNRSSFTTTQ